jgi:hypothetical protein
MVHISFVLMLIILVGSLSTIKEYTETFLVGGKENGLQVNAGNTYTGNVFSFSHAFSKVSVIHALSRVNQSYINGTRRT